MNKWIAWAIGNAPGMNTMMLGVLIIGGLALYTMRRETFPNFELEVVMVTVPYPGATPEDVEEGICQKVEESVRSLDGIKKVTSIAQESFGYVLLELRSDVKDVQKVLAEVDREVNRISTFPARAEDPQVTQITFRSAAIRVGIIGPEHEPGDIEAELALREVAEKVRDDLLQMKSISTATVMGGRPYQIDVEIPESTLRSYGLTLESVATAIRERNVEVPGGQLKSEGQEVLLRAKNKSRVGEQIAQLPIITQSGGGTLTLNDIGRVRDEFEDVSTLSEINGKPAMVVNVERTKTEDLLAMVESVRKYVNEAQLPPGYKFQVWNDTSVEVRGRLELLISNGYQGLILVFVTLALFLDMRLAFWVAMGIPISIFGAGIALAWGDQTLNMLSLFSFLMALGIVVDDGIVIGENIHSHQQMGKSRLRAAIDGATEVMPSVAASVATTIIAFAPMFFVSGVMGKFMEVIPYAVIAMLTVSLFESTFVLPCHLAHPHNGFFKVLSVIGYPLRPFGLLLEWANRKTTHGLDYFCNRIYAPVLHFGIRHPMIPIMTAVTLLLLGFGLIRGGVVPTILFPKTDNNLLHATIAFPNGTSARVTDEATRRMEEAIRQVSRELAEERAVKEKRNPEEVYPEEGNGLLGPVRLTYREVGAIAATDGVSANTSGAGGHVGQIFVELFDTEIRDVHSDEIIDRWRRKTGEIAGYEKLTFGTIGVGPGGKAIEFKLLASGEHTAELQAATESVKECLRQFAGVYDIADDNTPGKWEFQFAVKDSAISTGVTETDLGETVRNAYYGAEAMRLQRGRHEVKLMVRYPEDERRSLVNFREIRVRDRSGNERPISEVAEVTLRRGFSEINRVDQKRSITITADIDEITANSQLITNELQNVFMPQLLKTYPNVSVRWEGQREQSQESVGSLKVGFVVAILAMFILLVLQFQSYSQPLLILVIIPFGMIGAIFGHALMGLPLTFFSMFGLVALSGVVVNDSIVLIDFINSRVREGASFQDAIAESGVRRFRPILLTSLTTIAGLVPLLFERSFQAQLLIPMATSLAFGLMVTTVLVLLMIPVFYSVYARIIDRLGLSPSMNEDYSPYEVPAVQLPQPVTTGAAPPTN